MIPTWSKNRSKMEEKSMEKLTWSFLAPKISKMTSKATQGEPKERPRRPQVTPRRPQGSPRSPESYSCGGAHGPGVPVRGKEFLRRLRLSAVKTNIKQFYTTLQDKSTIAIDSTATLPTRTGVPEGNGADLYIYWALAPRGA